MYICRADQSFFFWLAFFRIHLKKWAHFGVGDEDNRWVIKTGRIVLKQRDQAAMSDGMPCGDVDSPVKNGVMSSAVKAVKGALVRCFRCCST
jgi:hypothetical protein